ncbi:GMC family oxidoreductase [Algimonas arctica]|uniref:GMC family oxidoreductase n=1 Tax=Algimonas arctica TaxID=1479486 RepID=A0A8J3CRS2_9PROT|nr:GMC family oxidoreductase [Algimonas arctica]GHA89564.1 GMC family oxidoreductase [Algimonas arctica]
MADFDVIVVGSGMSGGWIAKEMSEKGFKVAVIERGRKVEPEKDYTDHLNPWDKPDLNRLTEQDKEDYPIQHTSYAFHPDTKQFWVKDKEHPYEVPEGQSFTWRRGYHEGGRSIMWGRQSYRMSEIDFEANKTDGHGVDWPVRTADMKPWYDYVETFAGISGSTENLEILPDSVFQPPHDLTCAELDFKDKVEDTFPGRRVIPGRVANLTAPTPEQTALGRGRCQARNHCFNGCSYGAYFSSNSATLPAARRTGNMTFIPDTAVHKVVHDKTLDRATGVETVNIKTGETKTITARVIFLNAGTIPTSMILLNSANADHPNGLANSSGQLGHNLMDHHSGARGQATMPGNLDKYHFGRRPNGFYIPRFRNHTEEAEGFIRGFGYQGWGMRSSWGSGVGNKGVGTDLKDQLRSPGAWSIGMVAFGEVLPNFDNHVRLHPTKTDKWGFPIPILDAKWGENERNMVRQATRDTRAMLEVAGAINIWTDDPETAEPNSPGNGIHEMGTARMGRDAKTSVLNGFNQSWDVPNLFITDGSFMASGGCQNPSLTYMAFSARAANHAAELMKEGVL